MTAAKDQLNKAKKASAKDKLVKKFSITWLALAGQSYERELRFHRPDQGEKRRLWKFDFCWPDALVAVELEGGIWGKAKSRHTTGIGFHKDCEKYNTATMQGWAVIRLDEKLITYDQLREIRDFITRRLLVVDGWKADELL